MKSVYIHIPFCKRKCLYCDFCSTADRSLENEYVKALIKEIEEHKETVAKTVFIGGGTPSVIGDNLLKVILAVKENFTLTEGAEFTVEVNPGTVSCEFLKSLRKAGVNRLSMGVQSFNDNELTALGRIHSAREAEEAFYMAREAGFDNINIDLMLSTPLQTLQSVKKTLEYVKKLKPEHVSAYSLIIEEGTPFYEMELDLPDEDTEREIYHYTVDFLEKEGLERYEISNFAKKGYDSEHNKTYWECGEYIGLGCGAHSYCDSFRYANSDDIKEYITKREVVYKEFISDEEKLKEKFMLGLRMSCGVEYKGEFSKIIQKLEGDGLISEEKGRVKLTQKGFDLANLVFMEFV